VIRDVLARGCLSRSTFENLTAKWAGLTVLALGDHNLRFNALRRRVEGISEKMLSQTLQSLERDGMVTRQVITAIPPHVEYALTPLGHRTWTALRTLADLLQDTADEVRTARAAYDREHPGTSSPRS
jgi:DNA-binding HxlR family transcriptional regulator